MKEAEDEEEGIGGRRGRPYISVKERGGGGRAVTRKKEAEEKKERESE